MQPVENIAGEVGARLCFADGEPLAGKDHVREVIAGDVGAFTVSYRRRPAYRLMRTQSDRVLGFAVMFGSLRRTGSNFKINAISRTPREDGGSTGRL